MSVLTASDSPSNGDGRLVRKTAVELVVNELRSRILNGELPPGSQLLQESLAQELGVSRIPLREAFRLLSAEGLVEQKSHRSVMVSLLSSGEVEELFDIRLRLEPWLLYKAAKKISDANLAEAERLVVEMDQTHPNNWGGLNWRLHEVLYSAAEKPTALAMVKALHDKSERYFRFQVVNAPIRKQAHKEHIQLIEFCRGRKPKQASDALEAHIKGAAEQILSIVRGFMDEQEEEKPALRKGKKA
ncbi:MAG: GntR family transcriptional regulator [Herminiimonas sp.]|nr:GntR family transcriptional regulator [Herminiimonas sp.]